MMDRLDFEWIFNFRARGLRLPCGLLGGSDPGTSPIWPVSAIVQYPYPLIRIAAPRSPSTSSASIFRPGSGSNSHIVGIFRAVVQLHRTRTGKCLFAPH